nr:uncharacterized protein LOC107128637 [Macaca fascicularis]
MGGAREEWQVRTNHLVLRDNGRGWLPPPPGSGRHWTLERTQGWSAGAASPQDTMAAHTELSHASPVLQKAAHALRVHTSSICASQHSVRWWPCSYTHQDLGLEGTLLTDILYRDVAFLNLVDPISHDLLVNLATTPASTWDSTAAGLGPEPRACCAR